VKALTSGLAQSSRRTPERRERRSAEPVDGDDEQRLFARRANQADRLAEAEDVSEPLQRQLRAVGDFGAADEPFEQSYPRDEEFLLAVRWLLDRDAYSGDARVRPRPVAPNRGPSWRADGHQCGRPGR
jgi:hypothetical protein